MQLAQKYNFVKDTVSENQMEDRYGRKLTIFKAIDYNEDKSLNKVYVQIHRDSGDRIHKYEIVEYFKKDGTTDYITSGKEGDLRKYNDYLQAEVFVADLIGSEIRKEKQGA